MKKKYEDASALSQSVLYDPNFRIAEYENVNLTLPDELAYRPTSTYNHIPAIPKYGCLKNGTLPTYRNYTQKNRGMIISPTIHVNQHDFVNIPNKIQSSSPIYPSSPSSPSSPSYPSPLQNQDPRQQSSALALPLPDAAHNSPNSQIKKNEVQTLVNIMNKMKNAQQIPKRNIPNKQKRTLRRTYTVGKSKTQPKISVLVSNKTIRKSVLNKTQAMKQIPIREIKKYLIKKGFIRVGSIAPNDVLHKMYETSLLMCGEIQNHNPENILYNYINNNEN